MTYPGAIRYLASFVNYEQIKRYSYKNSFGLARIKNFLRFIHNPEQNLKIIHVAGTKGKGSTCAFVAYILREAGFSVGLYTSPHLNDFRERIRILVPSLRGALGDVIASEYSARSNPKKEIASGISCPRKDKNESGLAMTRNMICDFEGMISQKELSCLVKEFKPIINKYNRQSKYGALSFFEVYTAIAFLYFKRKGVDFAVLETGMGGSLDATNAADSLVCGITPVSFEHMQNLGSTLAKIAGEKAGIIKNKGAVVLSAFQDKEAAKAIHNRCKRFQARLYEVGRQVKYFKEKQGWTIKGSRKVYKNLRIRLLGAHQIANASLAVGLVEALSFYGFNIGSGAIRRGLYNTIWPGRCEVVGRNPLIVLDGAQNLASAVILKSAIRENFKYKKLILVLGISADKDISGICKTLAPLADAVILTRASTSRAANPLKLSGYFRSKVTVQQLPEAPRRYGRAGLNLPYDGTVAKFSFCRHSEATFASLSAGSGRRISTPIRSFPFPFAPLKVRVRVCPERSEGMTENGISQQSHDGVLLRAELLRNKVYLTQSVQEAKLLAKRIARPEDLILVTGSLFVVGEFRDV